MYFGVTEWVSPETPLTGVTEQRVQSRLATFELTGSLPIAVWVTRLLRMVTIGERPSAPYYGRVCLSQWVSS